MSTPPNDPVIEITRSILTEAAQRPWLAALLMRRRPDWLTRLAHLAQRVRDLPRHTRRALRRKLASGLAAAALLLALAGTPMAYAGGVVGTGGDPLTCTEDALDIALSGGGLVTFNCGPAPLTIIVATKTISVDTTIDGGGLITLSGNNANRVIEVSSGAALTLTQAAITGGSVTGNGGGIVNYGTLTVQDSDIISNTASSGHGGGIYNSGTLTVITSTLSGNSAYADGGGHFGYGGGIYNSGMLTVTNSTLSGNTAAYGGGILSDGPLTVQNSDILSNTAAHGGGGIYNNNSNTLTVQNSDILSNTVYSGNGGGIRNAGTLMVITSTLSGNRANANPSNNEGYGGGIQSSGTLTVTNSTLSGNTASYGGGIYNDSGTLTVQNSTLSGNTVTYGGGGIDNSGTLTVTNNSTITGNEAGNDGGGIRNSGTLMVMDSTLSSNAATNGGGIDNSGPLRVTNSTLSGNTAGKAGYSAYGGGINNSGPLRVTNSTLSGNTASAVSDGYNAYGGGIYNSATLMVTHSTIANNNAYASGLDGTSGGGGIYGTATISNSIVVSNTIGVAGNDCSETLTSGGYNIGSDESCGFDPIVVGNHDQWDIDPVLDLKLQPLANNGVKPHPFTHALGANSVAIDQIDPGVNGCVAGISTDERGAVRAGGGTHGGDRCDIGAYEVSDQTPTAITLRDLTATANTSPGVIGAALAALAALGALLFGRRVKGKSQP